MRALRAICTGHQHLVTSNTQKTLISFQNPNLSRHFTCTTRLRQQQQPSNPDKWAEPETETGKQYMGVRLRRHSGRFQASFGNKKRPKVLLGEFDTAEEAALAYDRASYRKYGPKARLNFPHLFNNSDSTTTTTTTGCVQRSSNKKLRAIYVCSKCGERHPLWVGQCRGCGVFNAVKQHFSDNGGKDIADKSHDIVKSNWSAVESDSGAGSIGIKGSETEAIELDKINESNRSVVESDSGVGSISNCEMAPASWGDGSGNSDKIIKSSSGELGNAVESIGIKECETAPASLGIGSGESENSSESSSDAEPRRVWSVFAPTTTPCPKSLGNESGENEKIDKSIPDPDPISGSKPLLAQENSSKAEQPSPQEPSSHPKVTSNSEPRRGWSHFTPTNRESVSTKGSFKKSKGKVRWVCSDCGEPHAQWGGQCRSCGEYNTLKQFSENGGKDNGTVAVSQEAARPWLPRGEEVKPVRLKELNRGVSWKDRRIPLCGTFGEEVAMVLGGGVVPGSLVLIGGDPGVGKSTLALQIASIIAQGPELGKTSPVVYVSGEESIEQIGGRADRMGIDSDGLFLYSSTDIEDIFEKIQSIAPQALVIDSIQTVYLKGVAGSAGGIVQVRECTSSLLYFAKKTNIPIFLIGHVTKSGEIAGPRVLEHIVDVVLYMEGEKGSSYRLLRSVKNRFGSTDELGVFEMSQSGLQSVLNPSGMFLGEQYPDSDCLAGLAVAVIMDGNRSFLIEIQALCVSGSSASLPGSASPVSRKVNGIQGSRADMVIAVLAKQAGLKLQDNAIFLNVISGETLKETAGDLAIAVAICSSFLESPVPNSIAFIGEIGLSGELRSVPAMEKRINTVAKLGYETCIVPKSAEKSLEGTPGFKGIKIIACNSLKEVINNVFK